MEIKDIIYSRELSFSEMFPLAFSVYRANFKKILWINLIVFFPISIVMSVIWSNISSIASTINFNAVITNSELMQNFILSPEYSTILTYQTISNIIQLFVSPIGIMAIAIAVDKYINKEDIAPVRAVLESFSNGATLIIATLIFSIGIICGSILFVIPGLILGVKWYFYIYSIPLSRCKSFESLKYSSSLVKGRFWRVVGTAILIAIINFAFNNLIDTILSVGGVFALSVLSGVLQSLVTSVVYTFITIWFLNIRHIVYPENVQESFFDKQI